jgi:hypothetical protein
VHAACLLHTWAPFFRRSAADHPLYDRRTTRKSVPSANQNDAVDRNVAIQTKATNEHHHLTSRERIHVCKLFDLVSGWNNYVRHLGCSRLRSIGFGSETLTLRAVHIHNYAARQGEKRIVSSELAQCLGETWNCESSRRHKWPNQSGALQHAAPRFTAQSTFIRTAASLVNICTASLIRPRREVQKMTKIPLSTLAPTSNAGRYPHTHEAVHLFDTAMI